MAEFLIKAKRNSPVNAQVREITLGLSDVMSAAVITVDGVNADTTVDWINDENQERRAELLQKVGWTISKPFCGGVVWL